MRALPLTPPHVALAATLIVLGTAWAHDFVGPQTCQSCHPEAYEAWRASRHARAYEALSPPQQADARCTTCHAPAAADQRASGVSCETCHGGGQYYALRPIMKDGELARLVGLADPTERGCRSCHDQGSPSIRTFDFKAKLKEIDHWSAERKRRGATASVRSTP